MCGIVGARHEWLLQHGLDPEAAMQRALECVAWRGPDGARVLRIGDWWLGCARLAISQDGSSQPVMRRGGRLAAVVNGAVTNARDLWARLLPGAERRPAPPNDAWLPLLAVQQRDAEALRSMRGHHAYVVVDLETQTVVLGQDRFGEKPLFCLDGRWPSDRELLAFASTPAALRELGMPASHQPRRLGDWFRFGFADATPHRFHTRLRLGSPPRRGEPLALAADASAWCVPWSPADSSKTSRTRPPQPTDLRTAAIASVARCTDTTVPAALLLSGGVDSSCLAACLRAANRLLPAYQFRAEGAQAAERDVARAVAAHSGLQFRPVDGGAEVLDALPRLTLLAGLPLGDPSILAVHAVARAAAADGIRVVLGGEGADELFLGYRRYRALAHMLRLPWLRAIRPAWSMSYLARWWRAATSPDPAAELLAVTPPAFGTAVLAPGLVVRRCWGERPATRPHDGDQVLLARAADIDGYLRCDLLPKVDVATMAAGIEARCPWLEGDFAHHGDSRRSLGKAALRTAFAADLPTAVFRLPKRGFSLPLDRWFRGSSPWLDVLTESRSMQRPHVRPGGIRAAIDRHRSGRADLGHGLYLLLAYEVFLRSQQPGIPSGGHAKGAPQS